MSQKNIKDKKLSNKVQITTKDIALIGVMIAVLEVTKQALAFLPNVEITTLLIILFSIYFGKRIFYVIPAFILLEGCIYGFGNWWAMYAYIWPLLGIIAMVFRKNTSVWFWSFFSAVFGLFFGALCSLTYLVIGGPKAAFTWWIAGIPYDILHCISNFILCVILYTPLTKILKKLRYHIFVDSL